MVEIVIVVLIMGIVAAIATPKYVDSLQRFRVEVAAQSVVSAIDTLRFAARSTSEPKSITFDIVNNLYTLTGVSHPDHKALVYSVSLNGPYYQSRLTSVALGGDNVLVFNGYGVPDSGGTIVLAEGAHTRTITVDASTGRASTP